MGSFVTGKFVLNYIVEGKTGPWELHRKTTIEAWDMVFFSAYSKSKMWKEESDLFGC